MARRVDEPAAFARPEPSPECDGRFMASVAHEVTQPLAAIVTSAQAGLRWLDRPDPDLAEVRTLLMAIARDGAGAAETIQAFRRLASPSGPHLQRTDPRAAAHDVLDQLQAELQSHGVKASVAFGRNGPSVMADRVQLERVFSNLVRNALDALADVDGERVVAIGGLPEADAVRIWVRDSGPGLPIGLEGRIFEPLFTTKATGMGMGLAICRSIVEAHGGRLKARACRPGAELTFTLPKAPWPAPVSVLRGGGVGGEGSTTRPIVAGSCPSDVDARSPGPMS